MTEEEFTQKIKDAVLAEIQKIRKRISLKDRKERRKEYRLHKSKIKLDMKKYRKSAKGKKMLAKAKRMNKIGKTATGKRQSTIIN